MATTIIITVTLALGLIGVATVIWSILNTRKKFYEEYKTRKRTK